MCMQYVPDLNLDSCFSVITSHTCTIRLVGARYHGALMTCIKVALKKCRVAHLAKAA